MAKCAICGNEVHSGLVVDPECLEKIQAENAYLKTKLSIAIELLSPAHDGSRAIEKARIALMEVQNELL